MKTSIDIFIALVSLSCTHKKVNLKEVNQQALKNEKIRDYLFLDCMYQDDYFPKFLVDKGRLILLNLCLDIETQQPQSLEELYKLTQAVTEEFNDLEEAFLENDNEIETIARECISENFDFVATAYGFEADTEELIAGRDW